MDTHTCPGSTALSIKVQLQTNHHPWKIPARAFGVQTSARHTQEFPRKTWLVQLYQGSVNPVSPGLERAGSDQNQLWMNSWQGLIHWVLSHSPHIYFEKGNRTHRAPHGTQSSCRAPQKSFNVNKERSAINKYWKLQILSALAHSSSSSARKKVELRWTESAWGGKGKGFLNYLANSFGNISP